eukprot:1190435-Prorocentrum_minimum.AAC.2
MDPNDQDMLILQCCICRYPWGAGDAREASPGVDGQKGLRLQLNSRQSSSVDTNTPFSARHFEYSIEYSTYIPCRQTAIGWPTVDSGAWPLSCCGCDEYDVDVASS